MVLGSDDRRASRGGGVVGPRPAGERTGRHPVKVEFTAYEGNPVILKGAAGEWDSDIVWEAAALRQVNCYRAKYD